MVRRTTVTAGGLRRSRSPSSCALRSGTDPAADTGCDSDDGNEVAASAAKRWNSTAVQMTVSSAISAVGDGTRQTACMNAAREEIEKEDVEKDDDGGTNEATEAGMARRRNLGFAFGSGADVGGSLALDSGNRLSLGKEGIVVNCSR